MTKTNSHAFQNIKVLVIEDDQGLSELIASALSDRGYECLCFFNGKAALDFLKSHNPPKLLVLDYSLPDMSGAIFLEKMRTVAGNIPFVIVTGRDDAGLAVSMMKTGAYDYLLKDSGFLDRLPAVVTKALQEIDTQKKLEHAKNALRLSEARLVRAQKIARMGSWEWDSRDKEIYCSDELFRIFGLTFQDSDRIRLDHISSVVGFADFRTIKRTILHSLKTLHPFNIVGRVKTTNNDELVVGIQGEIISGKGEKERLVSGTVLDITDKVQAESAIQQLVNYDPLTGLPNRSLLYDRAKQALAYASRDGSVVWLLCLDLDRFKGVNETLGHRYGDKLLQEVAGRLAVCVRERDTLARLSGDEFVIILNGVTHERDVTVVVNKILGLVAESMFIDGHELYTTASVGIVAYPMDGEDIHALMKHADIAMYKAKEQGGNRFHFFSRDLNAKVVERMTLENSMRKGLERNEFFMLYQPQVDVNSGCVVGSEALIRWNHPEMGLVMPGKFINFAEQTGFIIPLTEWTLTEVCRQNKEWQDQNLPPVRVSVNLSGKNFGQTCLVELIFSILLETGLDPRWLELEITESVTVENAERNIDVLRKLKDKGIALAIDDFGTGYSSLSYLKNFPLTHLKIDRSLVQDITTNSNDAAIAEVIIAIAKTLQLGVIAEGVETVAQREFLASCSCPVMQGYLFSYPLTPAQFADLLKNGCNNF